MKAQPLLLWWGSGQALKNYAKVPYGLFWVKVTEETAGARRTPWPSSLSPWKPGDKPFMWKVPSLYQEADRHPYHQR